MLPSTTLAAIPAALSTFTYQDHPVRTIIRDGEPWWVAKDVCDILDIQNPSDTLAKCLDDDEKGVDSIYTPGGSQQLTVVNEPGLYSLVLRSRKPEARQFKRWITHEVLPSLRKTGSYQVAPKSLVERARLLLEVAERQAEQEQRQAEQERQLAQTKRIAQAALDQAESNYGMFTVLGFARMHHLDLDLQDASKHGSKLKGICLSLGIDTGRMKDPRFGYVNTYPEKTLAKYFQALGLITLADSAPLIATTPCPTTTPVLERNHR